MDLTGKYPKIEDCQEQEMSVLLTPDANGDGRKPEQLQLPSKEELDAQHRSLCLLQKLLASLERNLQYCLQLLPRCSKRAVQPQQALIYSSLG